MKILLVDDSPTIIAMTGKMLEKMGHSVTTAGNGAEAVTAYERERPDLILMDVAMPVMDGYTAAQQIRSRYPEDWVPIIFLSALQDEEQLDRGINAGGDDYLVKPVSPMVLQAKIHAMQRIDEMRRRLVQLSAELAAANRKLERLSRQDALTELANRRYFDAYLADEISRAQRTKKVLAVIMCDVDFFKPYNDYYGHQAGDQCLRQVATAIESCCGRPGDLAARYGGEEFALILPETELDSATRIAEEIRSTVAELRLPHARSKVAPHITLSAGVVVYQPGANMTADQLIAAADSALYQAKHLGRNRIVAPQQLAT